MNVTDLFQKIGIAMKSIEHPRQDISPEECNAVLRLVKSKCVDFSKTPVVITVQLSDGRVDIGCNYAERKVFGQCPLPPNVTVEFYDYSDECDSYAQGTKHHTMPENDDHYGQKWTWNGGEVIQ